MEIKNKQFLSYYEEKVKRLEAWLKNYIETIHFESSTLKKAVNYVLFSGGKRLRPVLLLSVVEMLGKRDDIGLPAAAGIETFHTSSLIHDDLPALDNDSKRRGKPSCHIAFSEGTAILTGDYLIGLSFKLLTLETYNVGVSWDKISKIIEKYDQRLGPKGLVSGEFLDIENKEKFLTPEMILKIHLLKTAYLIIFSLEVGAIIGNASEKVMNSLIEYGKEIGIAFQIRDDIIDYSRKKDTNEPNYARILGTMKAKSEMEKRLNKAYKAIEAFREKGWFLREIIELINTLPQGIS